MPQAWPAGLRAGRMCRTVLQEARGRAVRRVAWVPLPRGASAVHDRTAGLGGVRLIPGSLAPFGAAAGRAAWQDCPWRWLRARSTQGRRGQASGRTAGQAIGDVCYAKAEPPREVQPPHLGFSCVGVKRGE